MQKVTDWEKDRCKWEATIAIELAKRGRGVTWKHTGTNEPPEDLARRTPEEILEVALKRRLGARHRIRQGLPPTHKEIDEDRALEAGREGLDKAKGKRKPDEAPSEETTAKRLPNSRTRPNRISAIQGPHLWWNFTSWRSPAATRQHYPRGAICRKLLNSRWTRYKDQLLV